METFKAIGIMSGTSLDGLDLAYCKFHFSNGNWSFELVHSETLSYPHALLVALQKAISLSGLELRKLDIALGRFIGTELQSFIENNSLEVDLIGSHGHTIFHQPEIGLTHQIGDGNSIHARTGVPVVFDFRSLDLAVRGDGAPLVPVGDKLLFSEYDACLNLGGIANISFDSNDVRRAFDIVSVNMVLNYLSTTVGKAYDDKGSIARQGSLNQKLLDQWNALTYYEKPPPKSLGYEWFEKYLLPTLEKAEVQDVAHTYCIHAARQINDAVKMHIQSDDPITILVSGGGAYNDFLMECIRNEGGKEINWVIPDKAIVEFKEALIFAFLGVLRVKNEVNIIASATGASQDSVGGILVGHPSIYR